MRDRWLRPAGTSAGRRRNHRVAANILSPFKLALTCLCFAAGVAQAGPKIIEPLATIFQPPPEQFPYIYDVALDGNRLAVATSPNLDLRNVYVYDRSADGTWSQPTLVLTGLGPYQFPQVRIALQGNILVMVLRDHVYIAERSASGWNRVSTVPKPPGITDMGGDVDIDAGTIVVSGQSGRAQALVFRKNPEGFWRYYGAVNGESFEPGASDNFLGGDVDISGNTIVVGTSGLVPSGNVAPRVYVFANSNGTWVQSAVLSYPLQQPQTYPFGFGRRVALEGDTLVLGSDGPTVYMYRRSGSTWTYATSLRPPEIFIGPQPASPAISGAFAVQAMSGLSPNAIHLYQRDGAQLRTVAKLTGRFEKFDISGRTVIGVDGTNLHEFRIPTDLSQPPLRQDDFQDGDTNGWTPFLSTSWTVATSGSTRVYRQTNLASEARSILSGTDWTNQSVQADIKPTQFDGTDRWFGLAARYTDPSNYYYVTLRSSNRLLLRKMVNGSFQTLDSETLSIAPNQTYRVRLEAIGSRIRGYVGDRLLVEAIDTSLSHGQAGLLTYRTRADFDNVLVSPNPLLTLYGDSFYVSNPPDTGPLDNAWIETGTGIWGHPPEEPSDPDFPDRYAHLRNYRQTSLNGGARSHNGVSTDDQLVQTRAMPTGMAATGWFGVMARYIDDGNYYYLKVGNNGEASLRKLVDGAITELARAPFTASTNTWYTLRLEVVGTKLRAYINGRFVLEATDSSHAVGKYGLVTYRATATFDDFLVAQP
jgi:hypothetical protein